VSGFAGIVRLEPSLETAEADRAALAHMAEAIAFRGPDAQQQWHCDGASFAFSLLTTGPAQQAASQPVTLDGTAWLIGDVRLDRREELIDLLSETGKRAEKKATDEEVVLLAWKRWRDDGNNHVFSEELHGEFGFAIWEPARRELNCFRDVMGCRPFYYYVEQDVFSFSNTSQALNYAPNFTAELDYDYIADFLLVGWCPRPENSVYRKARRLPAGHYLTFSPNGTKLQRYQQIPIEEPLFLKRDQEYIEIYRSLLEKAVADRLPEQATAIFLSGGLDSGSLAATSCSLRTKTGLPNDLHAVTADLRPLFDDEEGEWARLTADHLKISFELSHRGNCLPFSGVENRRVLPEPLANPYWGTYLHLCGRVASKARVFFVGYGGDNVLNSETWSYLRYLFHRGRFAHALTSFAQYILTHGRLPPLRAGLRARFRSWLGQAKLEQGYPPWLNSDFERQFQLKERWKELNREPELIHPVHPLAYLSLTNSYWSLSLDREDADDVGLPLELRFPLFDFKLLGFLLRLPALPWCADKTISRRAMRGSLPEAVLKRPKSPIPHEMLLLHHRNGNWHPSRVSELSNRTFDFVDWNGFLSLAEGQYTQSGILLRECVPPIALNSWLNQIEKGLRIE
jgi:asparagine synthase (glutamine-hydrolysing)